MPDEAGIVVVGNPNNPTGTLHPRDDVLALVRPERLVIVDESFMDFAAGEPESCGRDTGEGLAVVRSLTKLWGLAGVRAGYLLGSRPLVERLEANRQPWSVNALACAAIETCAADSETPARVARAVEVARAGLVDALALLPGVSVWPSAANFVLVRLPERAPVAERLRARGIAIRTCSDFPGLGDGYVRVAVRRPEENRRLVDAFAEALR